MHETLNHEVWQPQKKKIYTRFSFFTKKQDAVKL